MEWIAAALVVFVGAMGLILWLQLHPKPPETMPQEYARNKAAEEQVALLKEKVHQFEQDVRRHDEEQRQRERMEDKGRDQHFGAMLSAINQAVQGLITSREPTLDEMREYCTRRNLWVGRPGDMAEALSKEGHVILTPDAWHRIVERFKPPDGGMSPDEWINRED